MSFFDDASLVFLPSGQAGKDGKAYSMKPTNGDGDFTFSRGSNLTSTRIDSNGLIAKGRENILKQSNNFGDTSAWIQSQTTRSSGQEGYDGSTDAWEIVRASGGALALYQMITNNSGVNTALSGVNTFSIYVKVNSSNGIGLAFASTSVMAQFDISDDSKTAAVLENGIIASTQEYVGNNFYRLSVTANTTASNVRLYTLLADGSTTSSSGATYIVQDAQVEIGLAVTEPILSGATSGLAGILEDSPRFDYSGGASCPSLLLEPSRTNLIGYSEHFDSWNKIGSPTITNNYGISPEGVQNSTRFETTSDRILYNVTTINADETFSIYMRGSGILKMSIGSDNFIQSVTSDWVRYEFKTTQVGSNGNVQIRGNGSAVDVELYGAQYERNDYPTSYIPNHSGGSVTRGIDAVSVSGLAQSFPLTAYIEIDVFSITTYNQFQFRQDASNYVLRIGNQIRIGATGLVSNNTLGSNKFALSVDASGNYELFKNGTSLGTGTITGRSIDEIRSDAAGYEVKQILVFPTALSDAECITLTS